ncbi:hypothetical protein ACI2JN_17130 [Ochrobactrum teleogrylli]|uniref:Uncharacterized protein n=3 Tax=Ochrobactrum TaxID=528 RepID=A0ABD5JVF5_9HYPH|nr:MULTISPECIES: hypothetical protein [Brucella]NNU60709.1 hypothetical protein [[Ochrobactrum] soli]
MVAVFVSFVRGMFWDCNQSVRFFAPSDEVLLDDKQLVLKALSGNFDPGNLFAMGTLPE